MNQEALIRAIKSTGKPILPYSGRGMFGRECASFTVESSESLLGIVAQMVADAREEDQDALVEAFGDCQMDSLGRSTVIYFPGYAWEQKETAQ